MGVREGRRLHGMRPLRGLLRPRPFDLARPHQGIQEGAAAAGGPHPRREDRRSFPADAVSSLFRSSLHQRLPHRRNVQRCRQRHRHCRPTQVQRLLDMHPGLPVRGHHPRYWNGHRCQVRPVPGVGDSRLRRQLPKRGSGLYRGRSRWPAVTFDCCSAGENRWPVERDASCAGPCRRPRQGRRSQRRST